MGYYTDIIEIIAPSEAAQGETVDIKVKVKNINPYGVGEWVSVTALYDGIGIPMSPGYIFVDYLATESFTGSFFMPPNNVRVEVWSYYYDYYWYEDDYAYKDIVLKVLKPEFKSFTISEYTKR